jgi:3-hydroxybutyryl-CoA dehydratase
MSVEPGHRFESTVTLTPQSVAAFATAAGDENPIHHDHDAAAASRYGRVIASGTHTTALLLGLTAKHFSSFASVVGLQFSVKFRRPVYADETITIEWVVVEVTPNAKLGGEVVDMRGKLCNASGEVAVEATGRVLVSERS